jgi:carboxyl-terminal processing protease
MPTRNLSIVVFTTMLSLTCYLKADRNQHAAIVAEAMQKIRVFYLEDVESRSLFEDAMSGMVESLDQYSAYISPDTFRQMEEDLDQEFGGVGIVIEKKDDSVPILILSPLMGTPAYRAGLRAGDEILQIEGQNTIGMRRKESVKLMRGKPGTDVVLQVRHGRDEELFEVTITREVIVVQSVLGDTRRDDGPWDYHLSSDPRLGYLRITTFGKHTVDELGEILASPENRDFEALLLDLRGNAGGLLKAAVETSDLFLERGRIVSTRGRDGTVRSKYDASSTTVVSNDLPIVVLINEYTASASEIVSACLQDYGRAVVVGERTWGKGTVQNLFELEGGRSAMKLTTASYWRPSGKDIHRREGADESVEWGVRPDEGFEIVLTDDETEAVVLERRRRDLYEGLERPESSEPELETQEPEGEKPPVVDRQLEAGVEYLRQQLRELDAETRTASVG